LPHFASRSVSEQLDSVAHSHARSCLLYPRGPRSGLGSIVPVHPRLIGLIRPTHRHIPISPHCGMRDAFAVLVRLGDPRVVPCFRCTFLLDMPSTRTTGSPSAALAQSFADDIGLRQTTRGSALPKLPIIRFRWAEGFRGYRFAFATACRVACPPGGSDRGFPQPTRAFTSELSNGSVTLPAVGYDYGGY
jgi:hypothetical protein